MEIKIKADEVAEAIREDKISREFYVINQATEEMKKIRVESVPIRDTYSSDDYMKDSYDFEKEVNSAIWEAGYTLVCSDGLMRLSLIK